MTERATGRRGVRFAARTVGVAVLVAVGGALGVLGVEPLRHSFVTEHVSPERVESLDARAEAIGARVAANEKAIERLTATTEASAEASAEAFREIKGTLAEINRYLREHRFEPQRGDTGGQ